MECMAGYTILLEEHMFPLLVTLTTKHDARICSLYLFEFTVSEKQMCSMILVALTAHHTPNFMSCN